MVTEKYKSLKAWWPRPVIQHLSESTVSLRLEPASKKKTTKKSLRRMWGLVALSPDKVRNGEWGLGLDENEPLKPPGFFIL